MDLPEQSGFFFFFFFGRQTGFYGRATQDLSNALTSVLYSPIFCLHICSLWAKAGKTSLANFTRTFSSETSKSARTEVHCPPPINLPRATLQFLNWVDFWHKNYGAGPGPRTGTMTGEQGRM